MGMIIFLVLAYPFLAAWIVGATRNRRLNELEQEVASLRETIQVWKSPRPSETVTQNAATPTRPEAQAPFQPESQEAKPGFPPGAEQLSEVQDEVAPGEWNFEAADEFMATSLDDTVDSDASAASAGPLQADAVAPIGEPSAGGNSRRIDLRAVRRPSLAPPRWLVVAKNWLLSGNLVAKLGLVILFIGVGFLLKYVAATVTIPIELRLAGVVLADLSLLGWGWRMRSARREIGLPVQGTAIAILMLVVFGAYYRYDLIPATFAFSLLVVLTAFTCLLAVLQDAPWLAAFGIAGGFTCPLLISTGEANHITLFSYYALLNAGVFALAIRRAWRPLNLLGFGFTFVAGTIWGGMRYTNANYASTQGFLILFFLFYVGIAIAYARHQHTRLKHYVDATLVLGTPLLAFGLQVGLVRDKPFGLALSALAVGSFYLTLALILWRQGRERWRVLVETFTVLATIFGTLAIPFAVDGRWTSAAWALEGAGFVWFGLRRQQRAMWLVGMLLQTGAWLSFIGTAAGLDPKTAQTSNLWLGFLLLAASAFAMARSFRQHARDEEPALARIANWCIAIAAIWLLAGSWTGAILLTSGGTLANLLAVGALLTAALLYLTSARLAWAQAGRLALAAQLAGAIALTVVAAGAWDRLNFLEHHGDAPLLGVVMIAAAALATSRMLDKSPTGSTDKRFAAAFLLWGGAWWFGPAIHIAAARLKFDLPSILGTPNARWTVLYAIGVAASAVACARLARRLAWPRLRWLSAASCAMLTLVTIGDLTTLYGFRTLLEPASWFAWAILWLGCEYVLMHRAADQASINGPVLRAVHCVRTAGPWLALWPTGAILIDLWLAGSPNADVLAAQGNWAISSAWSNYLPTWAMMLILSWLAKRSVAGKWPSAPLQDWYRMTLIPCGALLILLLAAVWNFRQDGTMAPLPYVPLLNPLDLTTGFALALCLSTIRTKALMSGNRDPQLQNLQIGGLMAIYAWFNLILLRSAAQYLGIPYQFEDLGASQFVQAMLSLVWSASALVLMHFAAKRAMRRTWWTGAVLLGVVLVKLITVDVASGSSVARVVSFVGVGLLMVLVGYLAPYPKSETVAASSSANT